METGAYVVTSCLRDAAVVPTFDDLLCMPPQDIARYDIATTNLLCASGLPGAEDMDILEYLRRLAVLTDLALRKIERDLPRFRRDPAQFRFPKPVSESFYRIINLVSALQFDAGLRYSPERKEENPAPYSSKDLLINGLLSDQRIGTCNSIPVVLVAVGRRLGYPLYLTATCQHVIARWEGGGERFNIDASCPGGFHDHDDDHYRSFPTPMRQVHVESGYYLRNFAPADETALFLFSRAWVLEDHKRFEESLPAWAKCCFLAPTEPIYPRRAYEVTFDVLHVRKFGKPAERGPDRRPLTNPDFGDLRMLLQPRELAMYLSITGHFHEVRGEIGNAIQAYRQACEFAPKNPDYPADRDRYLKRLQDLGKIGPLKPATVTVPGSPTSPKQPTTSAELKAAAGRLRSRLALQYEQAGLEYERADNWPEAQAAFVRANAAAPPDDVKYWAHLHRVMHCEIISGQSPKPNPPESERTAFQDPRLGLPVELQAVIWSARGRILECAGRFAEAMLAYLEAARLVPKAAAYKLSARSAAQWEGFRRRAAKKLLREHKQGPPQEAN
jgi:tetratricopeptide (TPR) repeat protein